MLPDDCEWRGPGSSLEWIQLFHRGWVVATIRVEDGRVDVQTGCWSQGFRPRRPMATVEGAKRYVEAWWARWEPAIRQAIASKEAQRNNPAGLSWPEGYDPPVYPDIKVAPRRHRWRR